MTNQTRKSRKKTQPTEQVATNPREYQISVLTPYLSEGVKAFSTINLETQKKEYGFDPNNLNGIRELRTDKGSLVKIWAPEYRGTARQDARLIELDCSDLIIASSTEPGEDEVEGFKGSGLVFARFSIFYGNKSGYSGRTPEQGGYSLDIPKHVQTVRSMLTIESVLEALAARNEQEIRKSLDELNKTLSRPILITPYLEQALSVRR